MEGGEVGIALRDDEGAEWKANADMIDGVLVWWVGVAGRWNRDLGGGTHND